MLHSAEDDVLSPRSLQELGDSLLSPQPALPRPSRRADDAASTESDKAAGKGPERRRRSSVLGSELDCDMAELLGGGRAGFEEEEEDEEEEEEQEENERRKRTRRRRRRMRRKRRMRRRRTRKRRTRTRTNYGMITGIQRKMTIMQAKGHDCIVQTSGKPPPPSIEE